MSDYTEINKVDVVTDLLKHSVISTSSEFIDVLETGNLPEKPKGGKLVLADGPIQLFIFNPKGLERFGDRVCMTCNGPIMSHWMRPNPDPELRGSYWCSREGNQASEGMKD